MCIRDSDGTIRNPVVEAQGDGSLLEDMVLIIGLPLAVMLVGVGITMVVYRRFNDEDDSSANLTAEEPAILEAEALIVAELVEGDDITDET